MNRLQAELQRLYPSPDAQGHVRALVLALQAPPGWDPLAPVWQAVQAELGLPAPAIAVSGSGYQLWFSLSEPVPPAQAAAFLEALCARYLADVAPERIVTTGALPSAEVAPERWSAFVAPDLAALFTEEPWLDLGPSADAQAELLSRLQSTQPADWQRALERLTAVSSPAATTASTADALPHTAQQDPRSFLLAVMNDRSVELHLRIEAAKALLPFFEPRPPR